MIPVTRAEDFYAPARPLQPDAWAMVPPAERAWRWVEHKQQRRLIPPSGFVVGHRIFARINHNRWVADCPCGSAQVVTPTDPRLACTECGGGWFALVFPDDVAAAEAAVLDALPHERNWWHPDDTAAWDRPPPPEDTEDVGQGEAAALVAYEDDEDERSRP